MRRIFYACVFVWLGLLGGVGRAAHVYFNLQNFTTQSVSNKTFKIAPASMPSSSGGAIVLREPQTLTTSSGTFYVSNVVAGYYDCTVSTPITPTTFRILVPDTNGVVYAFQLFTNGLSSFVLTNLYTGSVLWIDRANGNDVSGARNDLVHRFQSIGAAKSNAVAGDTLVIFPGVYTEHDLMKSNILEHFMPGASVTWTVPTSSDAGIGLFDDRSAGAAGPFKVTGDGEFTFLNSNPYNVNAHGAVVIISTNTALNFTARKVSVSTVQFLQAFSGFWVSNCASAFLNVDEITDTHQTWSDLDPEFPTFNPSQAMGIYWKMGPMHCNVRRITMDRLYAVWCEEPTTSAAADFYLDSQLVSSAFVGVYASGVSNAYRSWINAKQIIGGDIGVSLLGPIRVYVDAQKISATNGGSRAISSSSELWLRSEKVSSPSQWIVQQSSGLADAPAHITVQHFEATGPVNNGIQNSSTNELWIHGGLIRGGTNSTVLVNHAGGKTFLDDVVVDNRAATNATAYPITVSSNGLVFMGSPRVLSASGIETIHTNGLGANIIEISGALYVSGPISPTLIQSNGWLQVSNTSLSATVPISAKGSGTNDIAAFMDANGNKVSFVTSNGMFRTTNDFIATVSTSDANITDLYTFTPRSNAICRVTALINAYVAGGSGASYGRVASFKNTNGGVFQISSTSSTLGNQEEVTAWDATIDNSGNTIRVRVTGSNGASVNWGGLISLFYWP